MLNMSLNGSDEPPSPHGDSHHDFPHHSRASSDEGTSQAGSVPNGNANILNGRKRDSEDGQTTVQKLQLLLEQTMQQKEELAAKYSNLLGRLTTMRDTLGNKLKQDAEELDRREQLILQLTAQNEDLTASVNTLAQSEIERLRLERDDWQQVAMREKVESDDVRSLVEALKNDLEVEREAREREAVDLQLEREKSQNLQSVLADFQTSKDHELKDFETKLNEAERSLSSFKSRALTAEAKLHDAHATSSKVHELELKLKEKNLLIEKLRHETVIINEHLMEALRRLRRNSSESTVDRALVTNCLLNFLTQPRGDPKRFEMLGFLANVLSWTEQEREKAGLQRTSVPTQAPTPSFWSRSSNAASTKAPDLEKTDVKESFSRLWVEYLLTEAASGEPATPTSLVANDIFLPTSAARISPSPTHTNFAGPPRRLSSVSPTIIASSPNLTLPVPPRKGKEREM